MKAYTPAELLAFRASPLVSSSLIGLSSWHKDQKINNNDIWKAAASGDTDTVRYLLDDGVNVDDVSDGGETPLHIASRCKRSDVARLLLERGANTNAQDLESGWTPLHIAMYFGHVAIAVMLVQAGAVLDESDLKDKEMVDAKTRKRAILDFDGLTPLDLASFRRSQHIKMLLSRHHSSKKKESGPAWTNGELYSFGKCDYQLGYVATHGWSIQKRPRRIEGLVSLDIASVSVSKSHGIAATGDGMVYIWGNGRGGLLSDHTKQIHMEPFLLNHFVPVLKGVHVVSVSASEGHSLLLSSSGAVYSWGISSSVNALGHGDVTNPSTPRRIDALRKLRIAGIAAGPHHSMAFSDNGLCLTWGGNEYGQLGSRPLKGSSAPLNIPKIVELYQWSKPSSSSATKSPHLKGLSGPGSGVKETVVVVGGDVAKFHTAVLTDEGVVWTWGHGNAEPTKVIFDTNAAAYKRLKVKPAKWYQTEERRVPLKIMQVSCADTHSIAVSNAGEVFTWGYADPGVLGHRHKLTKTSHGCSNDGSGFISSRHTIACIVKPLRPLFIVNAAAGIGHTAVVTDAGDVFTWGVGDALGHGLNQKPNKPCRVGRLKGIGKVAVSDNCTIALCRGFAPPLPPSETLHAWEEAMTPWDVPAQLIINSPVSPAGSESDSHSCVSAGVTSGDISLAISHSSSAKDISCVTDLASSAIPSLKMLAQISATKLVNVRNVVTVLNISQSFNASLLGNFCAEWLHFNLDSLLSMEMREELLDIDNGLPSVAHLVRSWNETVAGDSSPDSTAIEVLRIGLSGKPSPMLIGDESPMLRFTGLGASLAPSVPLISLEDVSEPSDIIDSSDLAGSSEVILASKSAIMSAEDESSVRCIVRKVRSSRKKLLQIEALEAKQGPKVLAAAATPAGAAKVDTTCTLSDVELNKIRRKNFLQRELRQLEPMLLAFSEMLNCSDDLANEIKQLLKKGDVEDVSDARKSVAATHIESECGMRRRRKRRSNTIPPESMIGQPLAKEDDVSPVIEPLKTEASSLLVGSLEAKPVPGKPAPSLSDIMLEEQRRRAAASKQKALTAAKSMTSPPPKPVKVSATLLTSGSSPKVSSPMAVPLSDLLRTSPTVRGMSGSSGSRSAGPVAGAWGSYSTMTPPEFYLEESPLLTPKTTHVSSTVSLSSISTDSHHAVIRSRAATTSPWPSTRSPETPSSKSSVKSLSLGEFVVGTNGVAVASKVPAAKSSSVWGSSATCSQVGSVTPTALKTPTPAPMPPKAITPIVSPSPLPVPHSSSRSSFLDILREQETKNSMVKTSKRVVEANSTSKWGYTSYETDVLCAHSSLASIQAAEADKRRLEAEDARLMQHAVSLSLKEAQEDKKRKRRRKHGSKLDKITPA